MTQGKNLTRKLLENHLVDGSLRPNEENTFRVDQVLMQDATGTMACMQKAKLSRDESKVPFAIVYVDHNMLQVGAQNADDHAFLRTFAAKHGIYFSKAGNGICHQVHLERFARPGTVLVGSDSHTTTAGAMGCIAIGAGGLDVGILLAGYPFELETQKIVNVRLTGKLNEWVSAKDVILYMLQELTVKGGVGKIFEFTGPGLKELVPVTRRATIANMIAELGATAAVFPADDAVREYLKAQEREDDYTPLFPDDNAEYDEEFPVNLSDIEPMIAYPHSPDNAVSVKFLTGTKVVQVCAGSSVNSGYEDIALFTEILKGKHVKSEIEVTLNPGSKQILDTIFRSGLYGELIKAGVKINPPACGPCVGMGNSPPTGGVSVRTMNRNFPGRSGTPDDQVYLASPAVAAATALRGEITDPRDLGITEPKIRTPKPVIDDSEIIVPPPANERANITVIQGPNIKPPPTWPSLPDKLEGHVLAVFGDDISTGDISPDGADIMKWRSDLEEIADYTFIKKDSNNPKLKPPSKFAQRAKKSDEGFIVAGENYGQGSSREHAALAPRFLGVTAVFAKSFARIHRRNLIAQGVVPIRIDEEVLHQATRNARWSLPFIKQDVSVGYDTTILVTNQITFTVGLDLNDRERNIILAGGLLNYLK